MRKVLIIVTLLPSWCASACRAVSSYAHSLSGFGRHEYAEPPIPTFSEFNEVRRRDLLAGQMPAQAAPTQQATRPRSDQRPWLNRFLLPRNDFAFA